MEKLLFVVSGCDETLVIDTRDGYAVRDPYAVAVGDTDRVIDNELELGDSLQRLPRMVLLKRVSVFNLEHRRCVSSNAAEPSSFLYVQFFP